MAWAALNARSTHLNHHLAIQKTIWENNLELNFEINVNIFL